MLLSIASTTEHFLGLLDKLLSPGLSGYFPKALKEATINRVLLELKYQPSDALLPYLAATRLSLGRSLMLGVPTSTRLIQKYE